MLETRAAHGYCSRYVADEACSYVDIWETCDSYTPAVEVVPALTDRPVDGQAQRADAQQRGWASETERHGVSPQLWKDTSNGSRSAHARDAGHESG